MTATVFFRLLKEDDKEASLLAAVQGLRTGAVMPVVHHVEQETFRMIPGSPVAYWVSDAMRRMFQEFPRLEQADRAARRGPSTGDDFRRVRTSWEVPVAQVSPVSGWVAFSKGGEFSPYYADIHLVVAWDADIGTFAGFLGRPGRMIPKPEASSYFFRPGLTWPRRTTSGISFRVLPAGCVFADKGPALFSKDQASLASLLAFCNSRPSEGLVALSLGAADVAARSYEVGIVQLLPMPEMGVEVKERLSSLALSIHDAKRALDSATEPSHAFVLPALLQRSGALLAKRLADWNGGVAVAAERILAAQREIDETCYRLYGISAEDRANLEAELGTEVRGLPEALASDKAAADLLSWMVGVVLGRFDVRLAMAERPLPELPEPFAPLPPLSPGMLPDGLMPSGYPIAVGEDGILVDDEGHPEDIVNRLREVLHLLWPTTADAVEKEICALLGARSLRDYLGRTGKGGFWNDHFGRYAKSRRRAPIYWPLQSPRGLYRVWIYAHRLTKDTLPKLLGVRYLGGKLAQVQHAIEELRPEGEKKADLSKQEERRLAALDELLLDLEELAAQLRAVMERGNDRGETAGYAPDLNDGVVLAAAPLYELIPWPKTRQHGGRTVSELRACWEELADGEYDWARVTMLYWPARVTEKCRTDKSLALAHGLDGELFPGLRAELRRQTEPATAAEAGDEHSFDADEEDDV